MSGDWRNDSATEKQKEKLRFFGCTWDEGITKGQASDALDQCVKHFPEKESEWQNRPAMPKQLNELQAYGVEIEDGMTYGEAKELLEACELDEPTEEQKFLEHLESDEGMIDAFWDRINDEYGDMYRAVTREEVAEAWALVRSRKRELPTAGELVDGLKELFSDYGRRHATLPDKLSASSSDPKRILEEKFLELVAGGKFDKNDEKELAALAIQHGFDASYVGELQREKFSEEFEPIKRRVEKAHIVTDEDLEAIERIKKKYDIQLTLTGNAAVFRSIYLIESKHQLPEPIATGLMLNQGEVAYYSIPTVWHQIRVERAEITPLSEGVLYVTSERLLFCGNAKNVSVHLKKVVDCQFYSDFLKVDKSSGKPDVFSMNSPEARYVLALIRALK